MLRRFALLLLVAIAAPAVAAPAAAKRSPTAVVKDWSRVAAVTPIGSYLIGNPAAKVRLVEYMSYTCPHCAHFAAESRVPLMRDFVANGSVAFEVRNLLLNGLDFTAALAVRCGGAARFREFHEAVFAAQPAILEAGQRFDPTRFNQNPVAGMQAWARASGIGALLAKRGIAPAALDRCIASRPVQLRIQAMTRDAAEARGVRGTPTFFIGDRQLDTNLWEGVAAELRAALG